ncbi:MAG: nucleotide pyrophosphohydrolase [Clostridiales bacterium]|nr:nucleotide pyrophosphohydrolase [Eubacteriales bacterium]MDH7566793.1 nucleotide pyrophosphohydrolase [Clostridiales bacterium]
MNDNLTTIAHIKKKVKEFVDVRKWTKDHNPKNLSMCISIEAAELMEIFQWVSMEEAWNVNKIEEFTHLKEELADVLIYCFSLANQLGIDISEAIEDKMQKNEKRFPVK